jgi:putative intracellular protease/amidase/YHS domain-containing protein
MIGIAASGPVAQDSRQDVHFTRTERTMNRRELLQNSAAISVTAAIPLAAVSVVAMSANSARTPGVPGAAAAVEPGPLQPPAEGSIPVAFLISRGAVVIDFCGPWEVFENVSIPGRKDAAFHLYTVAETTSPVTASGGMKIVPNFSFETVPAPKIIVIPAQDEPSEATLKWIRAATQSTDVTMSVCTGAFVLAKTGLLSGKAATTHHNAYADLAMQFPDIQVKRGARFVEAGNLASAGGLSSGIDLALRVVGRYFGREVAAKTAYFMEYQGEGWTDPNSNQAYRERLVSTAAHPLCPVCEMDVDPKTAPQSVYRGQTYYFCMTGHKVAFEATPEKFVEALRT